MKTVFILHPGRKHTRTSRAVLLVPTLKQEPASGCQEQCRIQPLPGWLLRLLLLALGVAVYNPAALQA
jgi:hypothetical protein